MSLIWAFRSLKQPDGGGGDAVAPTLSNATGTATDTDTATLEVDTDEAGGTLYAVLTTSSTPPTKQQVKDGQDDSGDDAIAFSQAVAAPGTQEIDATGLDADTEYYAYFMHADAAGNQSDVAASDPFTTDAEAPTEVTATFQGAVQDVANKTVYDYGTPACVTNPGDRIVVCAVARATNDPASLSVTIKGASATLVGGSSNSGNSAYIYEIVDAAGGTTAAITVAYDSDAARAAIMIYVVSGAGGASTVHGGGIDNAPTATLNIPANGCAIGCAITQSVAAWSSSGISEDYDQPLEALVQVTSGSASAMTGGSTALTFTNATPFRCSGMFAAWGPAA